MNKLAYIAVLIYVPLQILYMSASDSGLIYQKLFHFNQSLFMLLLLINIALQDIKRSRKALFFSVALMPLSTLLYVFLDWKHAFIMNFYLVLALCSFSLLTLIIPLIYDRFTKK